MCKLMVRLFDKEPCENPFDTIQQHKAGDVVCLVDDSHAFSIKELQNPQWMLVSVPGVSPIGFRNLISPEMAVEPFAPRRLLQRRQCRLDLSALSPVMEEAQLRAAIYVVESVVSPTILA